MTRYIPVEHDDREAIRTRDSIAQAFNVYSRQAGKCVFSMLLPSSEARNSSVSLWNRKTLDSCCGSCINAIKVHVSRTYMYSTSTTSLSTSAKEMRVAPSCG